MPILRYTTNIDPDKTAAEIAKILSINGASAVLTEYNREEGYVSSLSFKMFIGETEVLFRLPCNWPGVLSVLEDDPKVPKARVNREQAVKTAWRIILNWVEAQMAFIQSRQVQVPQAFLAYAVMKDGQTLFEQISNNPNLLLGDGK
jgi:hypothetical protein